MAQTLELKRALEIHVRIPGHLLLQFEVLYPVL